MKVTEMIGKHLQTIDGEIDGVCVFCGAGKGTAKKKVISSSFMDWAHLRHDGNIVCPNCAACLSNTGFSGKALRSYSVICTDDNLEKAARADIVSALHQPPGKPYIILVNYSQKKHAFFYARINDPCNDAVVIGTDKGTVSFSRCVFIRAWTIAKRLYDGGFSKKDIELGNTQKYKTIEEYGVSQYYADMAGLSALRETNTMQLLLHLLYKEDQHDQN